jgi:hypothetical protein
MAMRRGVGQYVLVGAALDIFAFRRADVRDRLRVFELDHPQSQPFKRDRLAAADLADPPNPANGVVDFEHESIAEALGRLPLRVDQSQPSESLVNGHPDEPGCEVRAPLELLEVAVGAHVGLLYHVLGLAVVARHRTRRAI